jgi:ABC-type branched-subunit amino acid transport system substrate-binding protein
MNVFSTRRVVALAAGAAATATLAAATVSASATSASSAASGTLNIGVIYPFTGANASQGAVGIAGCLVGVAPVNAAGGVLGKKLVCKTFDTKGDPADAVPAANQMLASANPVMVLGASDDAVATAPIVTAAHIVNFATIGDPHFDNQTNPYFYRLTPSDALQGKALGYYAAKHGLTHAAAAFTSDLGAQTSVPPLRTEYKKLGHKLVADLTLAPGASSYRTEVEQVIGAHPDALITEMDPQSQATFMSEYQQLAGHLPLTIGTERTATSDVLGALRSSLGVANMQKYIKTITPYVGLTGAGYELYKKTLMSLSSKIPNASQYLGHPYTISDFDAVSITALAMNEAHSTNPSVYNKFVVKVTAPAKGATVVHSYAQGLAALKAKKTIQYVGASGPLVFDKYHSAGRSFSYDKYDAATKSMVPVTIIPGAALNG